MNADLELPQWDASLGATLRALRQAQQIELGAVSARLKFSVRQLQALEDEDWSHLPSGLALRGMVRNYARYLQTDVTPLLLMLDAQTGSRATGAARVATPTSLADVNVALHDTSVNRPWGWMLLILLVLIVVITYAIGRGWVPDAWLPFDWLRALRS